MLKSSSSSAFLKSYQSINQLDITKNEKAALVPAETDEDFQDEDFQWTREEEADVVRIIDKYLMIFILLMTFVLNMDRTNICKSKKIGIRNILIQFYSKCDIR
jgi:hypothetical protein